jgi:hypothetical protein
MQMQQLMVTSGLLMRVERIIYILPAIFPPSKCLKRWKNPCFEPPDSEPEKRENTGLYTLDNLVRITDRLGLESLLFPDQTLPFARIASPLPFGYHSKSRLCSM